MVREHKGTHHVPGSEPSAHVTLLILIIIVREQRKLRLQKG